VDSNKVKGEKDINVLNESMREGQWLMYEYIKELFSVEYQAAFSPD
jgi:hypothetical protein